MSTKFTQSREICAHCGRSLPQGIRVALFVSPDADDALLGDFCTVAHAIAAVEALPPTADLPNALSLGIRVDRNGHDETALAGIMLEMVRVAVRDPAHLAQIEDDAVVPNPAELN